MEKTNAVGFSVLEDPLAVLGHLGAGAPGNVIPLIPLYDMNMTLETARRRLRRRIAMPPLEENTPSITSFPFHHPVGGPSQTYQTFAPPHTSPLEIVNALVVKTSKGHNDRLETWSKHYMKQSSKTDLLWVSFGTLLLHFTVFIVPFK